MSDNSMNYGDHIFTIMQFLNSKLLDENLYLVPGPATMHEIHRNIQKLLLTAMGSEKEDLIEALEDYVNEDQVVEWEKQVSEMYTDFKLLESRA